MWNDPDNLVLNRFRAKKEKLKGICSGGCRIRGLNQHGDIWAEDSLCDSDGVDKLLPEM